MTLTESIAHSINNAAFRRRSRIFVSELKPGRTASALGAARRQHVNERLIRWRDIAAVPSCRVVLSLLASRFACSRHCDISLATTAISPGCVRRCVRPSVRRLVCDSHCTALADRPAVQRRDVVNSLFISRVTSRRRPPRRCLRNRIHRARRRRRRCCCCCCCCCLRRRIARIHV